MWQSLAQLYSMIGRQKEDSGTMTDSTTPTISPRQREMLTLLAEGLSQKEVAKMLGIRPRTVRLHLEAVRNHTGALNTIHAIVILRHTILSS